MEHTPRFDAEIGRFVTRKLTLPLLTSPAAPPPSWHTPSWHGWTPAEPASVVLDGPEPTTPQGEYGPGEALVDLAAIDPSAIDAASLRPVELLAPAGGMEAAYAALHFGADAIYLGLKKFSARAEAENFTLEQVNEITAYAHSLSPRRRILVAINTLIRQDEVAELIESLAALSEIGVDAVILQDLGVYRAIREHFPNLELHGSTQMAVHNRAGVQALRRLGFRRVVLARELTFEEVRDITAAVGVETEVFIHGALCYSYSGLCLFSAQTLGRSGNRGKCAYSCRDSFTVTGAPLELRDGNAVKRDPRQGFPFSMKDLALPDHLPALRAAGVACFKIEGRKKSPLYVATTTDYYRRLLDATLGDAERPGVEADLQTVFSRPWTPLFVHSHKDKEVADRDTVGHRGTPIGQVEAVRNGRLRFRTRRPLERHDGIQIDLPTLGKPFGFAVDRLWVVDRNKARDTITAPAGAMVEIALPADHPALPKGAPVYCSSSQQVKQRYRYHRPKPGAYRVHKPLAIETTVTADRLTVVARAAAPDGNTVEAQASMPGPFTPAQDAVQMEKTARATFERLGNTAFSLGEWRWTNPAGVFVPVSRLNVLRREVVAQVEAELKKRRSVWIGTLVEQARSPSAVANVDRVPFAWSIKGDCIGFLDAFDAEDWRDLDEAIIDIARDHPAMLRDKLEALGEQIGRERIRLALPALTRAWEENGIRHKIESLLAAGWRKWEAANLSAWTYLASSRGMNGVNPAGQPAADPRDSLRSSRGLDLSTDWSVYVINRLAAQQVLSMGATRFALSPEDGLKNQRSLLAEFPEQAVLIVHQDTPLFIAESCAYANLIGGCPGKANCRFESMEMTSSFGESVTALDYHCRTIVLNQGPFCLSPRLAELAKAGARRLRADFIFRHYDPAVVRDRWRLIRAGKPVPGGHAANYGRGLE